MRAQRGLRNTADTNNIIHIFSQVSLQSLASPRLGPDGKILNRASPRAVFLPLRGGSFEQRVENLVNDKSQQKHGCQIATQSTPMTVVCAKKC